MLPVYPPITYTVSPTVAAATSEAPAGRLPAGRVAPDGSRRRIAERPAPASPPPST